MAATILFLAGPGGAFYNEQFLWPDGGKFQCTCSVNDHTKLFVKGVHWPTRQRGRLGTANDLLLSYDARFWLAKSQRRAIAHKELRS